MKAYKGFNADMTCRGFQYAEGGTYETAEAELCKAGFHACLEPMDVLAYYHPSDGAVIHEVEVADDAQGHQSGESGDSKVATRKITIGARLDIVGMVKAHLAIVWDRVGKAREVRPDQCDQSTAATSGDRSTAATSGDRSTAATSGDQSTAATSGYQSTAAVEGRDSIALAGGYESKARGAEGCWLVLVERDGWDHDFRILAVKGVRVGSKVHGIRIEPGVLYALRGGRVVAA